MKTLKSSDIIVLISYPSIKKLVRRLFGVLKRRNPRVGPEDVERVIEEVGIGGS
ncbi:MAG: hypothetical protein GSR84_06955 [Desulfurococcales archaeon]|nr:hypothetical protein [Desulfurococcales archaeon]